MAKTGAQRMAEYRARIKASAEPEMVKAMLVAAYEHGYADALSGCRRILRSRLTLPWRTSAAVSTQLEPHLLTGGHTLILAPSPRGLFFRPSFLYCVPEMTLLRYSMNDTTTRRTDNVRVKLAPDMMERLERMAGNYGMPTATLCAFAIAEWVTGKENNLAMSRMAVMDMGRKMGGQIGDMISQMADSPEFDQIIGQASVALSQTNLPLDGEAKPEGGA